MNIFKILKCLYSSPKEAFAAGMLEESFEESIVWYLGLLLMVALWFGGITKASFTGQALIHSSVIGILEISELVISLWIAHSVLSKRGFKIPPEAFISGFVWSSIAWIPLKLLFGLFLYSPVLLALELFYLSFLRSLCVHALSRLSLNGSAKLCLFATLIGFLFRFGSQKLTGSLTGQIYP